MTSWIGSQRSRRSMTWHRPPLSCPGRDAARKRCGAEPGPRGASRIAARAPALQRIAKGALRCVRGTRVVAISHFHPELRHKFAFSRHVVPELCGRCRPQECRGRREGRVPAGTRGPLCETCVTRSCTAAYRCSRTSGLPCVAGLRLMSYSPRGALHYCPRRLAADRCAHRLAATSPQDLTPEPRAPGPYDFAVREPAPVVCARCLLTV